MNSTPNANKKTVCIFGRCNSGKSSLFNAITGTNTAIVSDIAGTTTDPVIKSMELLPHGPIVIIDTAGIGDNSPIGDERIKRTKAMINRADLAIYAISSLCNTEDIEDFQFFKDEFEKKDIPFILVMTKKDLAPIDKQNIINYDIGVSIYDKDSIEKLKNMISDNLDKFAENTLGLIQGVVPPKSNVILVIPIDSEAPKGRLILPQVQLIRDCLDNDIVCTVSSLYSLADVIKVANKVDLVITDSQAFKEVDAIVPKEIPLTSFSILTARQKGDLDIFINGINTIKKLQDNDKILIAETCTHSTGHDDIGQVKIPMLIQRATGKTFQFNFVAGRDYPEDLDKYALVIHCGGCMITRKEMMNRIYETEYANVPITNYGIILAYCNGIFQRSIEILQK